MRYTLSIIIPTLNEEKFLPTLLQNLAKQREKNFEVILVDAESTDKTCEVALSFQEKFPLQILTSTKHNVAYQKNHGAAKAKGKYLVFLDADAQVYPSFTQKVGKIVMQKRGVLLLPSLVPDVQTAKNTVIFSVVNATIEASQTLGKPLTTAGVMFIEKNFFNTMNGFDVNAYITEDHDFVMRARKLGVKARFLKDVKVIFSMRRARKEGEFSLLVKYIMTAMQIFVKGKVKQGTIEYEMGGHVFSEFVIPANKKTKRRKLLQ